MAKGISLHIGLNVIDANVYGTNGALTNPINDARSMHGIASSLGYKSQILLDAQATAPAVVKAISSAADTLSSGDIFFLSYAGHGSQVGDITAEEEDGKDETWVLYDRMLIDDELYALWSRFKVGVRIIVVSDSCHSGTMTRGLLAHSFEENSGIPPYRCISNETAQTVFDKFRSFYEPIKITTGDDSSRSIGASVLLLSGCQDNQLSSDGSGSNGRFTEKLMSVWKSGGFNGNYQKFASAIKDGMPPDQTPNYFKTGAINLAFEAQVPFTIETPREVTFGEKPRNPVSFTLQVESSYLADATDADVLNLIRTDGADCLINVYKDWKESALKMSATTGNKRGFWEVKCEKDFKTGEAKCSGSVGGTF